MFKIDKKVFFSYAKNPYLTPKIPSIFLTNFRSFWPTWRDPFLYQKKYENLRK
jgi:hypothetical protein